MLKSYGWWGGVAAHKILETAQSSNSSFPFLFGLVLGTWDLDSGLSIRRRINFSTHTFTYIDLDEVNERGDNNYQT